MLQTIRPVTPAPTTEPEPVLIDVKGVDRSYVEGVRAYLHRDLDVFHLPALSATSSQSRGEVEQAFRGGAEFRLGQPWS